MTAEEKTVIDRAASLGGDDTSQFVRRVALLEARRIIAAIDHPTTA